VRALWRVAPLVPCGTLGVKAGRCSLTQATCVLAVVHLAGSRRRCARRLVPAMPTVASHAEACAAALDAADPGGQRRLTQELEFVQLLASPSYIHWLAQEQYLQDAAFINYLRYLTYWLQPEYARLVRYPHALYFLELLQDARFREAARHPAAKDLAHTQQFFFWQHHRVNRFKAAQGAAAAAAEAAEAAKKAAEAEDMAAGVSGGGAEQQQEPSPMQQ